MWSINRRCSDLLDEGWFKGTAWPSVFGSAKFRDNLSFCSPISLSNGLQKRLHQRFLLLSFSGNPRIGEGGFHGFGIG